MKIVYHVESLKRSGRAGGAAEQLRWATTGTGDPYACRRTERPAWNGFQVKALFAGPNGVGGEDCFELEGDGEEIKHLLSGALSTIEAIEVFCREQREKEAAHAYQCTECHGWVVLQGHEVPEHGDGKGNRCCNVGPTVMT